MKAGAIEFQMKPFQERELLTAVAEALRLDRARRHGEAEPAAVRECYNSLTSRQREVMQHVRAGVPNKDTAATLNVGKKPSSFIELTSWKK